MNKFGLLLSLLLFISCNKKTENYSLSEVNKKSEIPQTAAVDSSGFRIIGDSVEIPKYQLEINLSDDALKKLNDKKESIIVSYYFYGNPKDGKQNPEIEKNMDLYGLKLLEKSQEVRSIKKSTQVTFSGLKFSKNLYDALSNKDISLNINVYSGRRSFDDNILDMEAYDGPFNDILKHSGFINLNGKLLPQVK